METNKVEKERIEKNIFYTYNVNNIQVGYGENIILPKSVLRLKQF